MNKQDLLKFNLPDTPGVYIFKKHKEVLYIGKATSLRQRVASYFSDDLIKTRGRLLVDMITLANSIEFKKTDSVLEALILESDLIKKYQPKYNTKDKDNKSYNYVVVTEEDFPRVLVERGRNLEVNVELINKRTVSSSVKYKYVFGPYPYGGELKEALNLIRKIFPFRDKCEPGQKRACFNRTIGLCPGVCTGEISKSDYAKQIKNIKMFFEGKKIGLIKKLEREMHNFAKEKEFEKANKIKKSIFAINHIQDVSLIKNTPFSVSSGVKIESYDVAHMSGKDMVGGLVVMEGGEFNKKLYRKFIINNFDKANDIGALKEMIERRLKHTDWVLPDIVIADGNNVQISAIIERWPKNSNTIFCGVVKDERHKAKQVIFINEKSWDVFKKKNNINQDELIKQIIKINEETHRFTIAFHKKRRNDNFI